MSRAIHVTNEAYEFLLSQKREGYSLKLLASEPIVDRYKPLLQAQAVIVSTVHNDAEATA